MSIKMGVTKTLKISQQKRFADCFTQALFEAAGKH